VRSFRDPAGWVEDDGRHILRHVGAADSAATQALLDSALYAGLCADGWLVPAQRLPGEEAGPLRLEHRRITWPSYPFEWTAGMLADAGVLTLDLQARAWAQGYTLKDAAANNLLFDDGKPVFCDLLSLQRRAVDDAPGWEAYGQFVRHFILPLLAIEQCGRTPRDIFLAERDGLRAAALAPHLSWRRHAGLAMLLHVWLPARLERRRMAAPQAAPTAASTVAPARRSDGTPWLLDNLRRLVQRLDAGRRSGPSTWRNYTGNRDHYEQHELAAKRTCVEQLCRQQRPRQVLDIGANNGEFAELAARAGARVLALDDDVQALDALYRRTRDSGLPIQCLHANFARPSPATGWRLDETLSLPARLQGQFDLVLMLAVVHHLLVSERVPIDELMAAVAQCCTGTLVLEFVPRSDPRFIEIAGRNLPLYAHWSLEALLRAAAPYFSLSHREAISEHRQLLTLQRHA